jgi:methionyl-tRNA formyltransferase
MAYRAIFLGTFDPAAAAAMRGWLSAGHEIASFWHAPLKRAGALHRDTRLGWIAPRWSVQAVARRNGFPVRQIPKLASWPERVAAFAQERCDVLVSVYFPNMIPADVLEYFGARAVNLHPAPLPRYRGPNPIHAMVLDRSIVREGAMTLHVMTDRFDEGPIIAREPIAFPVDGSFVHYLLNAAAAGRRLTATALPAYLDGRIHAVEQDSSVATYIRVAPEDMLISSALPVEDVRLRCQFFARRRALALADPPRLRVSGFVRELGPPTGAPPRARAGEIDLDILDRRVLLKKRTPWSSLKAKFTNWRTYMATPD